MIIAGFPTNRRQRSRKSVKREAYAARANTQNAAGLCVRCDAPARAGKRECEECAARPKGRKAYRKATAHQENIAAWKLTLQALKEGLCVECKSVPAKDGKNTCEGCSRTPEEKVEGKGELIQNPLVNNDDDDDDGDDECNDNDEDDDDEEYEHGGG